MFKWFGMLFSEADGNGGKPSFARVFGGIVVIFALVQMWRNIPTTEFLDKMFMFLIGYSLLSKALNTLTPAMSDIARAILLKSGGVVTPVSAPEDHSAPKTP